jgi:hypothetical protein
VPDGRVGDLEASFIEQRFGYMPSRVLARIAEHAPQIVVVFGVATLPSATVGAIDVPVVAWDVAPDRPPGFERHPDLPFRRPEFVAAQATPSDYAHVVDRPLPVADERFASVRRAAGIPRALVIGHSSERLERLLVDSKHRHELMHIAAGLSGAALTATLAGAEVAINVRDDDAPGFGARAALYLAAGLLLISEPLRPSGRLRAGTDHLEIRSSDELVELLGRVRADPDAFTEIRVAGRQAAEAFRASRVYPELLTPLVRG